ncbi:MAG: RNA polymerase sigma factor [bacterium]
MADNDFILVRRCLDNDTTAFEELLNRHKNRIFSFILRIIRNQEDAEDLAQETFIKAFRGLHSYNPAYPFITWLFRIAHNACMDFLRARKPQALSIDADNPPDLPCAADSIGTAVDFTLRHEETEKLLASLPTIYAEILLLQYREDMTGQQIADVMQIPEGTVKVRLFRAKALMRNKLETMKPAEAKKG